MTALNTDKFKKVAPNTGWQLGGSGIADASVDNFELISALGIPTGTSVRVTIDRVDASGAKTPAKMERIVGIVDGNNIIDCIRGDGGTAQPHSGSAVVEILISDKSWNDLIDGILAEHKQDGTHNIPNKSIQSVINAPRGFLLNGKIDVSVVDNDLTVTIKTLAGENPSVSNPVYCRIGDTIRSITGALSRTLADGTNWFNAGSTELATKEIDYFAYLVWDSNSSAVGLTFARIPFANLISDFTETATTGKHCAGYADFTTTDEVENIGRFAATLSAGAGYTWSIPTFTASNLIQRPIFETRNLDYQPVYTTTAPMTFTSITTKIAKYKIINNMCFSQIDAIGTTGGTASSVLFCSLAINRNNTLIDITFGSTAENRGGYSVLGYSGEEKISFAKYDGSNYGIGASKRISCGAILYEI